MASITPRVTGKSKAEGDPDAAQNSIPEPRPIIWAPARDGTYQYRPLDASKQEIRLFRIDVNEDGEAEGHIEHFNLKDFYRHTTPYFQDTTGLRYRAMSYTWGSPDYLHEITVDGQVLSVRRNLFNFFYLYLKEYQNEYLWVDQICIDQSSTLERNDQVHFMAKIYERAAEVLVWLGLRDHDGWIPKCYDDCEHLPAGLPGGFDTRISSHSSSCLERTALARYVLANWYWSRLWIVQEVLLGGVLKFCCGTMVLNSESDITALSNVLQRGDWAYQVIVDDEGAPVRSGWTFIEAREFRTLLLADKLYMRQGHKLNIVDVYTKYPVNDCSDDRDKVYGLQSLVSDDEKLLVDYRKTIREVFLDAVEQIFSSQNDAAARYDATLNLARRMGFHLPVKEGDPDFDDSRGGILAHYVNPEKIHTGNVRQFFDNLTVRLDESTRRNEDMVSAMAGLEQLIARIRSNVDPSVALALELMENDLLEEALRQSEVKSVSDTGGIDNQADDLPNSVLHDDGETTVSRVKTGSTSEHRINKDQLSRVESKREVKQSTEEASRVDSKVEDSPESTIRGKMKKFWRRVT